MSTPGNSQEIDISLLKDKPETSAFLNYSANNSIFMNKNRIKELYQIKTEQKLKIFKNRLHRAMYGVRPSNKILSGKIQDT
jgi:hypothetical protein